MLCLLVAVDFAPNNTTSDPSHAPMQSPAGFILYPPLRPGILRVMILSQLAPHRLAVAPEAPIPLAGLLEEVAALHPDGEGTTRQPSTATESEILAATGVSFVQEVSVAAAAGPAELGWEEQPSCLVTDVVDQEAGGMKEVSSLQVCGVGVGPGSCGAWAMGVCEQAQ